MLKHDWMRNRERRTHRVGREDDAPDAVLEDEDAAPDEGVELAPSPFLFDEAPALDQEIDDSLPAVEDEDQPAPPEADGFDDDLPAVTYDEDGFAVPAEPVEEMDEPTEEASDVWEPPLQAEQPPVAAVSAETDVRPMPEPPMPAPVAAPAPAAQSLEPDAESARSRPSPREIAEGIDVPLHTMRDRLEQVLAGQNQLPLDIDARQEVFARAESTPREQRLDLVQRLLDPTLNLQEVAMLLDVCTTTVRRYTDRGVLRCHRTPGNQRRFHLSDVLDFMERQQRGEL